MWTLFRTRAFITGQTRQVCKLAHDDPAKLKPFAADEKCPLATRQDAMT
jgi:hypothetical protein